MLIDLFLGVALPLWFATVYANIGTLVVLTAVILTIGLVMFNAVTMPDGDSGWWLITKGYPHYKKVMAVHIFNVLLILFLAIAPDEKFVKYTMYGIAAYNGANTLAETDIGKKTIQVASDGTNKVIGATSQVFDSSVSNVTGVSGLLNVWIAKKTQEFKLDMEKDLNPTDTIKKK